MSITAGSQQHRRADAARGRSASRAHRTTRVLAAIVAVAACLAVASPASAAELVTNGGFETGDFSDWTTTQPTDPLLPWSVADASDGGVFNSPSPPQGTYDALNGFDGSPGHYTLSQTISIPAATTTALTWQDRLQYAHIGQPRLLQVKILNPATDAVLATPYTYTTQPEVETDTGWQPHSEDLSAFSGQTVKLVFDETIPENFTGPGQAEFDAISVQTAPAGADLAAAVSDSTDPVALGDSYTYTTTVTNNGAATATNVSTTVTLSGSAARTIQSATSTQGSCSISASTVNCAVGGLANNASATITITVEPQATGSITATAATTATQTDPTPANNSDAESTTVNNAHGCTIIGTNSGETLNGTNNADVICALGGNDTINGRNGNDTIYAGPGNDSSYGEDLLGLLDNGADTLYGGPGNDNLDGQNGNDTLWDHDGTDTLSGSTGNDTINTQDGLGGDTANGGLGTDSCTVDGGDSTSSC